MKLQSKRAWQVFLAGVLLLISCDISTFAASSADSNSHTGRDQFIGRSDCRRGRHGNGCVDSSHADLLRLTPFPTQTPADTPSATPTFVFLLPFTLSPVATSTNPNPALHVIWSNSLRMMKPPSIPTKLYVNLEDSEQRLQGLGSK